MVATLARSFVFATCKLPTVGIFVAVSATVVFHGRQHVARNMALVAGEVDVFSPQREIRPIVVYFTLRDLFPSTRVVAPPAILPEFVLVLVFVAVCALVVLDSYEFGKQGVGPDLVPLRGVT